MCINTVFVLAFKRRPAMFSKQRPNWSVAIYLSIHLYINLSVYQSYLSIYLFFLALQIIFGFHVIGNGRRI